MTYLLENHQNGIADRALNIFRYYWSNPYTFRSDCEWTNELRPGVGRSISFESYCMFLWDYGLWKGTRWHNSHLSSAESPDRIFIRLTQCEAMSKQPDPYRLAINWVKDNALPNRQFSMASKLLFFMRPDAELMIYDSCAREAVKHRLKSKPKMLGEKKISTNFTKDGESFKKFMACACEVVKQNESRWVQHIPNVVGNDVESSRSFLLRRIIDKHLFLEGRILNSYKKEGDKGLNYIVKAILGERDERLRDEGVLGDAKT